MNQIRFDFLSSTSNFSRNANANGAAPSDAFSQILDQQQARRNDTADVPKARDTRGAGDVPERSDAVRPQVLRRRDPKTTAAATPAKSTTSQTAAKPKPNQPEKNASGSETCSKPAAKSPQDDTQETPAAAAGAQTTTESGDCSTTTEAEDNPDGSGDPTEQQTDGSQDQAKDGADQTEAVVAEADPNLLLATLAVPLPLQALAVDADAAVEGSTTLTGGSTVSAALQASLAARLAAVDFTATAKPAAEATAGGLKFGAVISQATAQQQKTAADPLATLNDPAEAIAESTDPLATPEPNADAAKPQDGSSDKPAKIRANTDSVASVNPEQNAKPAAVLVQPVNRSAAVAWSGTNVRNELAEALTVTAGSTIAVDDAEFSNWSQFLGSGASGLSARQNAFIAQLKQNLQVLPPHEQIAVQIKNAMQNGNSRLTVSLHPAELGRVEVKLDVDRDKNVTATVVVDRPATLDLLQRDAKALERALQEAGLQTSSGSLSFSLRDSGGQNGGTAQNGTGGAGGNGNGAGSNGSEATTEPVRPDVVAIADGYVDLET